MRAASSLPRARRGRSGAGSESVHAWVWRERERAACLDAGERGGRRKLSGQRGQLSACEITKGHSAGRRGRGVGVSVERRRGWLENVGRDRGGGAGGWRGGVDGRKGPGQHVRWMSPGAETGRKEGTGEACDPLKRDPPPSRRIGRCLPSCLSPSPPTTRRPR